MSSREREVDNAGGSDKVDTSFVAGCSGDNGGCGGCSVEFFGDGPDSFAVLSGSSYIADFDCAVGGRVFGAAGGRGQRRFVFGVGIVGGSFFCRSRNGCCLSLGADGWLSGRIFVSRVAGGVLVAQNSWCLVGGVGGSDVRRDSGCLPVRGALVGGGLPMAFGAGIVDGDLSVCRGRCSEDIGCGIGLQAAALKEEVR